MKIKGATWESPPWMVHISSNIPRQHHVIRNNTGDPTMVFRFSTNHNSMLLQITAVNRGAWIYRLSYMLSNKLALPLATERFIDFNWLLRIP